MKLADLVVGWDAVERALEDGGGELTPPIAEALAALDLAERDKVDGYVLAIRSYEGQAASYKAVEAELQAKRRTAENRIAWLKARVREYMEGRDVAELRGDIFRFALQKSGKAAVELLMPPDALPDEFKKITVEADKTALANALVQGKMTAYAKFGEPSTSLRIY